MSSNQIFISLCGDSVPTIEIYAHQSFEEALVLCKKKVIDRGLPELGVAGENKSFRRLVQVPGAEYLVEVRCVDFCSS